MLIKSFAVRLSQSRFQRHLFLLAASLLAIFVIGYHVGTFDQAIHIPFLKKYADTSLYPGDPFFDLRFQHYSYFWFFFQPLYRLDLQLHPLAQPAILLWGMFAAHVLATYLTFWAVWTLSDMLFKNPLTNVLAVVAFIMPHLGFAGFPVIEFSLLNRTFVLPFLLWAIIFFLRQRYWLAFVIMGLMYNLHVISVNFVLAMILFACVLELRRVGWRNLLVGLALFVVCALPVLIWKGRDSPVDLTPRPEWFSIISRGTLYNLFFMLAPYPHILAITACGVSALTLFFIGRRRRPSPQYDHTLTLFIYAVIIILAVEVVTAEWLPITIIVQSQIIRAGLFALVFGYIYFANYIVTRWEAGELGRVDGGLLAAAFIISPLPLVPVLVVALQRVIRSTVWRQVAAAVTVPVTFAASMALVLSYNLWGPGVYVYPHPTPWYDAQIWAKNNTPKNALFITPPEIWSFYDSEWRVFSERSTVATHSELLEAAFAPHYLDYWLPRFDDLAPGALALFRGNFFDNQKFTAEAYYGLSSDQLEVLAKKYGASYLVVEAPNRRNFNVCYDNGEYVIYALTAQAAAHCQSQTQP